MNSKHVRDLKFGMYLPCVVFHKFSVAIFKILIFCHFMAKNRKKYNMAATFWQFFGHKLGKIFKRNTQNLELSILQYQTLKNITHFTQNFDSLT